MANASSPHKSRWKATAIGVVVALIAMLLHGRVAPLERGGARSAYAYLVYDQGAWVHCKPAAADVIVSFYHGVQLDATFVLFPTRKRVHRSLAAYRTSDGSMVDNPEIFRTLAASYFERAGLPGVAVEVQKGDWARTEIYLLGVIGNLAAVAVVVYMMGIWWDILRRFDKVG